LINKGIGFILFWIGSAAQAGWLVNNDQITQSDLTPLLEMASQDPIALDIIDRTYQYLKISGPTELLPHFLMTCESVGRSASGTYLPGTSRNVILPRRSSPEQWQEVRARHIADAFAYRDDDNKTQYKVTSFKSPKVCISHKSSRFKAYGTLLHELTHLLGMTTTKKEDVLGFKDAHDYAARTILTRGHEVDAFSAGYGALIRNAALNKKNRPRFYGLKFFNSHGDLIDWTGLHEGILNKLGYESHLTSEFHKHIFQQFNTTQWELNWHIMEAGALKLDIDSHDGSILTHERILKKLEKMWFLSEQRIENLKQRLTQMKTARSRLKAFLVDVQAQVIHFQNRREEFSSRFSDILDPKSVKSE